MTESSIYWITRMDGVIAMESAMMVLLTLAGVISLLVSVIGDNLSTQERIRLFKGAAACASGALLMGLAVVFTPSTRDMLLIKGIPSLVNSDLGKAIPKETEEVWKLAKDYLRSKCQPDKADGENK